MILFSCRLMSVSFARWALTALLFFVGSMRGQTLAPGAIEGRVINSRTGEYLVRARVSVENTNLETFTNTGGQYRLKMCRPELAS